MLGTPYDFLPAGETLDAGLDRKGGKEGQALQKAIPEGPQGDTRGRKQIKRQEEDRTSPRQDSKRTTL